MDAADIARFFENAKQQSEPPASVWIRLKNRAKKLRDEGQALSVEAMRAFKAQALRYEEEWSRGPTKALSCRTAAPRTLTGDRSFFDRIERKYGLSRSGYLRMLQAQGSLCASCKKELVLFSSDRSRAPVVDHCHATGRVRALLCHRCNVLAGRVENQDSPILADVRTYLVSNRKLA